MRNEVTNLLERLIFFCLAIYAIFASHSIFFSEVFVILGLVLWLVKVIAIKRCEGKWLWIKSDLDKPIFSFFGVCLLSLFTAYDRFRGLSQIKSLWLCMFYFLVVNNIKEKSDVVRIIKLLVISAAVASIYGLFQYFVKHTSAVQAFIKNVITLAGLFLIVTPLSFALFMGEKKTSPIRFLITTFLIFLGLVFTLERSVWLGMIAAILVFLLIDRRAFTALMCGVIILGILFSLSDDIRTRARTISHFRNYAISSRFNQWQAGLEMMRDYPLTGVGPGNYEILYKQYKFFEERKTYAHSHSNIIQIGAETGILGLSIFFWMMLTIFRNIRRKLVTLKEPLFYYLSLGALAAFFGFHFAGFFEYNFGDSELQLLFWFIIGAVEKI
jgi:O-antigen ligase